jgi:hypothetical protein
LDHVHSPQKPRPVAPLLSANKEDLLRVPLGRSATELVLLQSQRKRLLAEDVFAGHQGFDRDFDVPVVGRTDTDDIDVLAIEDSAVIAADHGVVATDTAAFGIQTLGVLQIDVAQGDDIATHFVRARVTAAHPATADLRDL